MRSGRLSLSKSLLTSSGTRTAWLGSRLKRLHPAARIIYALAAHKFHTCRAFCVLSDVHAAGQNLSTFYFAVRGETLRGSLAGCRERLIRDVPVFKGCPYNIPISRRMAHISRTRESQELLRPSSMRASMRSGCVSESASAQRAVNCSAVSAMWMSGAY